MRQPLEAIKPSDLLMLSSNRSLNRTIPSNSLDANITPAARPQRITFDVAYFEFRRSQSRISKTRTEWGKPLAEFLSDWKDDDLANLNAERLKLRYRDIEAVYGRKAATNVFKHVRDVIIFAQGKYQLHHLASIAQLSVPNIKPCSHCGRSSTGKQVEIEQPFVPRKRGRPRGNSPVPRPVKYDPAKVTLRSAYAEFCKIRKLREKTFITYNGSMRNAFGDWLDVPIQQITKNMIEARFVEIATNRGGCTANTSFRVLKSVLNFAKIKYEDSEGKPLLNSNPVKRLSEMRMWAPNNVRQNHLQSHQYAPWFNAVMSLKSDTARDLWLFILLTGCRKSEASNLRWSDVDMENALVTFRLTKNGKDHRLPICSFLCQLLAKRRFSRPGEGVFERSPGTNFQITQEMKYRLHRISGVMMSPHDLRRSWAVVADSLYIERASIKRLLNHSIKNDVTEGYIVYSAQRYRKEVEAVADRILTMCGVAEKPALITADQGTQSAAI